MKTLIPCLLLLLGCATQRTPPLPPVTVMPNTRALRSVTIARPVITNATLSKIQWTIDPPTLAAQGFKAQVISSNDNEIVIITDKMEYTFNPPLSPGLWVATVTLKNAPEYPSDPYAFGQLWLDLKRGTNLAGTWTLIQTITITNPAPGGEFYNTVIRTRP